MKLPEVTETMWGRSYCFTPYLVNRVWGDGEQYIVVSPILIRPCYYVVRVPSGHDLDDVADIIDEIYEAIEEEFGPCCEQYSETGGCECDHWQSFPAMFEWGGSTWRDLSRDELQHLKLTPG